jgi:serine/threonine-protein kinase
LAIASATVTSRAVVPDPTLPADNAAAAPTGQGPVWEPGKLLGGGAYEVRRRLGSGGMGEVYEAYDRGLGRVVAIKALHRGLGAEHLREEARALAACRHPGVATAYALCHEDDVTYLVMERVYGVSLASLIDQRVAGGSSFTLAESLDLLIGLAEAVGAIHAAGIAHRDLKPDNIIVAPGGRVVVIDFGIFAAECAVLPAAGVSGTPNYMAPESIRDDVRAGSAHLVDVYAVGVMAFEMLTGKLPFDGESPHDVLLAHVASEIPDLRELRPDAPAPLAALVHDLLRKDPDERPQGVEPLLFRLRALRGEQATKPRAATFTVLIVDDDPNARLLTDRLVRRAVPEADVTAVADGAAAVRAATARPPHLLLLDLDLPGMNGIEVCLALRGTRAADHMAIVLVSGRAREHDLSLLRQLGVRRHVVKGPDLGRNLTAAVLAVRAGS